MKIDRLIGILTILLQNNKVTAPVLAERFEVSRRTILRDIDVLCQAGIPIVTTQGGDGGIAIMDGYKINKNVLTVSERENLIAALKGLDTVSKTAISEKLMDKIDLNNKSVAVNDSMIINLSSHYKDSLSEKISLLKKAISDKMVVEFDYYYAKGDTHRVIEPYFVEFRWNGWYILGWCKKRKDFRRFKLNRLWELKVTDEEFSLRDISVEQANAGNDFVEPYNMIIKFNKNVKFRLIDEYGLCCYEEKEDCLMMNFTYSNKDYAFDWVLSFADKAEIVEPLETRLEFENIIKSTLSRYTGK